MLRRALSTLSLAALAGAAALVPGVATAAESATLDVPSGTVRFDSATTARVEVAVTCGSAAEPTQDTLFVTVFQPLADDGYTAAADNPENGTPVVCDGQPRTVEVPLEVTEGTFGNGRAEAGMQLASGDPREGTFVLVTATGVPAPPKATIALDAANASPEPARKGKKITVTGAVKRNGKAYKATTVLEFRPDGGSYAKVANVKSDKKGKLSTTVKATRSGDWRYTFRETSTIEGGSSAADHVEVIPVAKKYKNCTALNKVYPHGVGRSGATDKTSGTPVTEFTRDSATYKLNTKSDRDKDGIACEKA